MLPNWKRLYVLGGLCCLAGIGSCFDRNEELPKSFFPIAEARELNPAVAKLAGDRTRALEIRFEGEGTQLTRESEEELANFLRNPEGRVREFKILVWADLNSNVAAARQLAADRGQVLRSAVATPGAPAAVVDFAEREADTTPPAQAAILAVME